MKTRLIYSALLVVLNHTCAFADTEAVTTKVITPALNTGTAPNTATLAPAQVPTPVPAADTSKSTLPHPTPAPTVAAPVAIINCNYHVPAGEAFNDSALVTKWAEKAIEQSFDYDHSNIDQKLSELKTCFTDPGWKSFNDALQKSGNINAIKNQKLAVSSLIEGQITNTPLKDNQWKITALLRVVYQNDKEKLVQPLSVDLVVGRKITGDLGIMQIIASPKSEFSASTASTNSATSKP